MLFIFGRDSRLEIEGAGVTGALGGAKNPHDIFINLDSAIQIGRRPHPSYFNVCDDDKNKMTSVLLTISGVVMNALAFIGTNFFFNKLMDHGEKERKRHNLAFEKLQRAKDKWNENRMKRLDFINKILRKKNETRVYINNVDEAMFECYQVFAKQIKRLPPEPQLSDFSILQKLIKKVNYYLLHSICNC